AEVEPVQVIRLDLSGVAEGELAAAFEAQAGPLQASLDLTTGSLMGVCYFDLGDTRPGRLLIIIHHLVVDGVSWRILLEDLQTAYTQLGSEAPMQLPAKTTSFKRWAERLVEYAQSRELQSERDHWVVVGRDARPLPTDYPQEAEAGENTVASA